MRFASPWPSRIATVCRGMACLPFFVAGPAGASVDEWQFATLLDGRPIGQHRFALARDGGEGLQLTSEAHFDVTLLGFTVYRYRHRSSERWSSNDCLASLDARTDENGSTTGVRGRAEGGRFVIDVDGRPAATVAGPCLMSFAYWNPALATQRQLLDPGTGRVEPVRITPLPAAQLEVGGRSAAVRGLRISGLAHPIDVWYAGERWVGLDTTVQGDRRLSYRLR